MISFHGRLFFSCLLHGTSLASLLFLAAGQEEVMGLRGKKSSYPHERAGGIVAE